MTSRNLVLITALVLTGLSAGFFYTYEISVTPALAEVDDITYVTTFQSINATVRNAGFALIFFGTVPVLVLTLVLHWNQGTAKRWLIATALAAYLVLIVITATGNVPLNNELAERVPVTADGATEARASYEADWNRLNLARTVPVVCSLVLLALASVYDPSSGLSSRVTGSTTADPS